MLSRIKQFALKVEGTEGTAESLAAGDVPFEVEELDGEYTNEFNERNPMRASLSGIKPLPGIGSGSITGKVELVGGGATTTVPPTKKLWLACGLAEKTVRSVALTGAPTGTFRPGEKITDGGTKIARFLLLSGTTLYYATISGSAFAAADTLTGSKSAATATVHGTPAVTDRGFAYVPQDPDAASSYTAMCNEDGIRKIVFGSRATANIEIGGAGKLAYANFRMDGAATLPIDQALYTGVTLPTVTPESFLSAGVAASGDSLCVDGFNFDLGNTLARRVCANAAAGIKSVRITDRKPTIKVSPERELEATIAFWSKYDAATEFGFYAQIGTTATKRVVIAAPNAMYTGLPTGDREGIAVYDAELRLNGSESDGDDEFIIAFF